MIGSSHEAAQQGTFRNETLVRSPCGALPAQLCWQDVGKASWYSTEGREQPTGRTAEAGGHGGGPRSSAAAPEAPIGTLGSRHRAVVRSARSGRLTVDVAPASRHCVRREPPSRSGERRERAPLVDAARRSPTIGRAGVSRPHPGGALGPMRTAPGCCSRGVGFPQSLRTRIPRGPDRWFAGVLAPPTRYFTRPIVN